MRRGSVWVLGALLGLLGAALVPVAEAASTTFAAVADAYVDSAQPSRNFGGSPKLLVDSSPSNKRIFLKFDVGTIDGSIAKATLRLYVRDGGSTVTVSGVANDAWRERSIIWKNAPAFTRSKASATPVEGSWLDVDVSSLISSGGPSSLAITSSSSNGSEYDSRQGANKPRLIVETQPTPEPSPTPSPTPSPSPPPDPGSGAVVITAAGDIATSGGRQGATASVVKSVNPDYALTLGDNAYPDGTLDQFKSYYDPTWGAFKSKTKPSPGNHDYHTTGAAGYFAYFSGVPAYYSFNAGGWHIISLNSEIAASEGSPQNNWLEQDLASSTKRCILAFWHKPLFSAGPHGSNASVRPLWDDLYAARADVILNGHDHNYQRFAPVTPAGATASDGVREFVVGTGGRDLYSLGAMANLQAGNNTSWGVLKMVLHNSTYEWRFVSITGQTYSDSGTSACH